MRFLARRRTLTVGAGHFFKNLPFWEVEGRLCCVFLF